MENESNSLNSMLLKAWRERWTDFQWGIHMKKVLFNGIYLFNAKKYCNLS